MADRIGKQFTQRQLRVGEMIKQSLRMNFIRNEAKNQTKQVSAGLECGITLKDFVDFQKNDVIEVYNSTITERTI